jgi:hypothetical protein
VVNISITIGSKASQARLFQSPQATQKTKTIKITLHAPQAIHPLVVTKLILSLNVFIVKFLYCPLGSLVKNAQRYKKKSTYASFKDKKENNFLKKITCC